jgi:hypothetical protein
MSNRRSFIAACGVAGVVLALAALDTSAAGTRAYLTFSAPVALPGVSLAPGTYTFQELSPDLVRVSSRDGRSVYLTAFTNQVRRPAGARPDLEIVLGEAPAGSPAPIEAWFPNRAGRGHAFIY